MPYVNVNGTTGNNFMIFQGIVGFYNETLINPYTGTTVSVSGNMNINNGIYDGLAGNDTLSMTALGDVLTLVDSAGVIMVKNVEMINAGLDGDVVNMSHATVSYGNLTIRGSDGNDVLWSNLGNDMILGGFGDDNIIGGGGNDTLFGGLDNDYLSGWTGTDSLFGGDGDDVFQYNADGLWTGGYTLASLGSSIPFAASVNLDGKNRSHDTFHGDADEALNVNNPGIDTLILTSGNDVLVASDALSPSNNIFTPRIAYIDIVEAGDGHDVVDFSGVNSVAVTINGGNGDDVLGGSNGNDTLNGGADKDSLFGGIGNDALNGGTGDDTYFYNLGNGSDTITETSGNDSITFGPGISFADLALSVSGANLMISIGSETLTVVNHFAGDHSGRVENILFDDGSTFDLASYGIDPDLQDDVYYALEDTVVEENVLGNDAPGVGDTLTVVAETITTANGGTVVLNADGSFSYQGAANFHGTETFSYTVNDNNGGTSTASVTLHIANVNDVPVAFDDTASGNEDEIITGSLLGNDTDVDGDTLTTLAETITTANGGTVTINADGTFSYTGATDFHGSDSFDYKVLDGNGEYDYGSITLSIASVNDNPVANNDIFYGEEDALLTGDLLANDTDVDGDVLTAAPQTITTSNGGTVTINADGTFSYQGALNFNGAETFSYTVLDGQGGTSVATASLTIGAMNDNPLAQDDNFSGDEDAVITGNVLGNDSDIDGDILSVDEQTITTANGGTVTISADGTFSYLGAANYNGNDTFNYTVRDTAGGYDTAAVTIAVAAVNDAPVAQDDSFTGLRNHDILGNVLAGDTDIDGDTLSVQAGTLATANGGTVVLNTDSSFTYTPANGFYGADSFDYSALDGNGGSALGTVNLTVNLDASEDIVGTNDGETLTGTNGNDEIFGLGGDDILYGDDGILGGLTQDKEFADTIVMPTLKEGVNINNLRPSGDPARGINDGNLSVDYDATASITFRKGYAGHDNSFGSFGIAADGTIISTSMEWKNVKTAGIDVTHQIDLPVGAAGGAFGFFIVANGNNTNSGYPGLDVTGDGKLSFVYDYGKSTQRAANINDPGAKISLVYNDGVTTKVLKGDVFFTTDRGDGAGLNKDNKMHVVSGLMDTNNLTLDPKAADLASKPLSFTKNGMTVSALTGTLIGSGDKIGIKSSTGSNVISGNETVHVAVSQGAEKIIFSLSDIAGGGTGIDFKIYLNGSTTPVLYEYAISSAVSGGKLDIYLDASQFGGGIITGVSISSIANSGQGLETFYIDNVTAHIPGGMDTNTLRVGFEDLYNMGDADYEDVLFDLDINPVHVEDTQGGNDFLDGGAGNDLLYGEGGDDILIIGDGLDQAHGGAGADVFALTMIDSLIDKIHDFDASEGDSINITDVLESYDPLADDIADFVRLVQTGADTELQISAQGNGSFVAAALIVGGTDDTIATLISNGALVADQSALA